jgi:hypothetical protein
MPYAAVAGILVALLVFILFVRKTRPPGGSSGAPGPR